MSDITNTLSLEFLRLGSKSTPDIYLAEPSTAGSTSLVFTSAITQEDNSTAPAKAMLLGFKVGGKVLIVYIAAGGFSSTTVATITTRPMLRGGLDFTTAAASSEDFDLPAGTRVYAVISAFHGEQSNAAQQGSIGQGLKLKERVTYRDTGIGADRIFADSTARDVAITSPQNGDRCYLTSPGTSQEYVAGTWTNDNAGGVSNASTSVAGKIEEATVAEQGTAAATGGTGARLFPANANLVKTSSGSGDENKIGILDAAGRFAIGFMQAALQEAATFFGATDISGAEAETLTDGSDADALHVHTTIAIGRKWGATTDSVSATSDTLAIAHGLGGTPNWVRITVTIDGTVDSTDTAQVLSEGESDGTTYGTMFFGTTWSGSGSGNKPTWGVSTTKVIVLKFAAGTNSETIEATVALDGTNIDLTYTNSDSSAQTIYIKWEVGF